MRTAILVTSSVGLVAALVSLASCSSDPKKNPACSNGRQDSDEAGIDCGGSCPTACTGGDAQPIGSANGIKDNGETDIDCGGPNAPKCADGKTCEASGDCQSNFCPESTKVCTVARADDKVKNGFETDIDCGGPAAPPCTEGKSCLEDGDCHAACNYAKKCVDAPSCKPHLGGDTCGKGEVGPGARHESCCRTLPVTGYTDPRHPDKTVYLDKYEITSGRVRAFINAVTARYGGVPKIRNWIVENPPPIWDASWNKFLPIDFDGEEITVSRLLLGDPRGGPDAPPVPLADETRKTGVDFQFNGSLFVYLHGNNCSTHAPTAFGFPTFFYPANVLAKMGKEFPPRADGKDFAGAIIPASEHLEVKAMNCISNALLAAFCHWDGGQLATDEVLDFVTDSPRGGSDALGNAQGCGTQVGTEDPPATAAATTGGRCADLAKINATYDAGALLPLPESPLNANNYEFPFFAQSVMHDKAWEIAAPGRGSLAANGEQADTVRIRPGDEPWMDLAGNLNEAVLTMDGATFTGKFGLKFRGIGYNSARSELNFKDTWVGEGGLRRMERPEAKAAFMGGRCMRFR
ncbi:MAG: hypothetical protein KF795_01080 [Labilithrix sp.]|nr:hypothetical protein [Labilithrix sp.]